MTAADLVTGARSTAAVETGIRFCVGDADTLWQHLLGSGANADETLRWPGVPPACALRDQDGTGQQLVQEA